MATVVVRHRVSDYDSWKPVFDDHETVRRQHGCSGHRLFRMPDDPNDIVISMEYPSVEAAQGMASDPSLPEAMERGGVVGEPQVAILEEIETRNYAGAAA